MDICVIPIILMVTARNMCQYMTVLYSEHQQSKQTNIADTFHGTLSSPSHITPSVKIPYKILLFTIIHVVCRCCM